LSAGFGAELEVEMEITTAGHGHGYKAGDMLKITTMDNRKWKRVLHWVTFRKPPTITKIAKISSVTTTTLTTEAPNVL
jgi:hypothetical protein